MRKKSLLLLLIALAGQTLNAKLVISENFDKFADGTDSAPSSSPVSNLNDLTQTPGWTGEAVFQAGGCAYLGLGGSLVTPAIDLTANNGNYSITFRAKSASEGACYFIMDSNQGYAVDYVTTEWKQYSIALSSGSGASSGSKSTSVYFLSTYNDIYIDDIVIDDSGIGIPQALNCTDFTRDSFTANWSTALNAESYLLNVYTLDYDVSTTIFTKRFIVKDKEIKGTSYTVTEGEFDEPYYYTVSAKAGDIVSLASNTITVTPEKVDAPTAFAATDVTSDSFTANWSASSLATQYYLHSIRHHAATANETFSIIDTDFSEIESNGTIEAPQKELEWTFEGDWSANMPVLANGIIGINNQDIDFFGQAFLQSPFINLEPCGGKINVSFTAFSRKGLTNATVNLANYGNGISFADKKSFTVSEEANTYSFELSGGSKNSNIVITSEDTGMMFIDDLKVTVELPAGSSMILPIRTAVAKSTSATSSIKGISPDDRIAYYVNASWAVRHEEGAVRQIPEVASDASNVIWIDRVASIDETDHDGDAIKITNAIGMLEIVNPAMKPISVYSINGTAVIVDNNPGVISQYHLAPGIYLVKSGNERLKIAVK